MPPHHHRAPSPPRLVLALLNSDLFGRPFSPPTPSTQLFFPLLKTHLSVGWGGFSIESKHVKIFQKGNKWRLYGALLALNRPRRQCYWYLPKFALSCTRCCLHVFVCSVVSLVSQITWLCENLMSFMQVVLHVQKSYTSASISLNREVVGVI